MHVEVDFGDDGLVPAVAQDVGSGEVLMLAYADREALARTRETGFAHYYSRSRDELWKKGGTSGHVQRVEEVRVDCDGDALLYLVEQTGGACHTGYRSCFYRVVVDDADAGADGSPSATDPPTDAVPHDGSPDDSSPHDSLPVEPVGERVFEPDEVYDG